MRTQANLSRRRFLKDSVALAAGGLALPTLIPRGVLADAARPGANDRIAIGFIGSGNRARLLMDQMPEQSRIVAISDCWLEACQTALKEKGTHWPVYQDYRKMLDKEPLDAVIVPTTDHARVLTCIHACQAGKDVYAEKPLTVCIGEGRVLVRAARKYKRVFQVGSQQRSMEMNRFACELVRSGGIGKLRTVLCRNYPSSRRYQGLPEQPIPKGLDWDVWCNQTELRPYNVQLHRGWMAWRAYSGGETTNWGAHGFDQLQWGLGMSHSGPVELWPVEGGSGGRVHMRYANGIVVRCELEDKGPMGGAIFVGSEGKIEINRNKFTTNPPDLVKNPPPPEAAAVWEGFGWLARLHIQNWLDCIRTREKPVADVEIGHRSVSVCHLVNITREIGRKIRWDPATETFPGDDEANSYVMRPRRKGYELPAEL